MKLEFEYLPIDSLKPYEKNARHHSEFDIGIIKKSIEQFGFNDPIGIWSDKNIIVEGHGRWLAAKELGMTELPVIRLDHLDDEGRRMYALEHNRSAEMSAWDNETLLSELDELSKFDLEGLGFGEFLFEEEEPVEAHDDDFNEDEFMPTKAYSKVGDLYILGKHRLICGDCKDADLVNKLVEDKEIDFVITDPPYGVDYNANGTREGIENDALPDDIFDDLIEKSYQNMYDHMKLGANIFVFHSDSKEPTFRGKFEEVGFKYHQTWQWVKQSLVLGHGWAHYQNEPILVGWKEGAAHFVTGRRDLTTVLKFDRPTTSKEHPTMKPLDLLGYLVNEGSKRGDSCLDLFGGSGSTLITCEQLNRVCYTMELDPKYADVIVKRYLRYMGSSDNCYLIRGDQKLPLPQEFISVLD